MSVLGEVFASLGAMSQWQLLLAFLACIGYVVAQGELVSARGRLVASVASAGGAAGFAFLGDDWTHGAMLVAFAVAGLGLFVAAVWLTNRWFGLAGTVAADPEADNEAAAGAAAPVAAAPAEAAPPAAVAPMRRPRRAIHSH